MNTLAERLRYSRKEVGLSQTDVAKSLKVSASAVNQWEQGLSKNIKLDHFFGLAQLLHQDPQWLATETVYPLKYHTQETPPVRQQPSPNKKEEVLLLHFRLLSDKQQKYLVQFVKGLSDEFILEETRSVRVDTNEGVRPDRSVYPDG